MDPILVTDKREWSSIDIFLFSNGQKYSPPRKYHLRTEELQWWGPTISYLGRTQFGSGHSTIELYAIDGTKINGPLELRNGAAYVAVEPPDSFVNTGYEEYLLKATRSLEKRLALKSYNSETSDANTKGGKDPNMQSNLDENDISENIADTKLLKVDSDAVSTPQKSRHPKSYQRLQKTNNTNAKQIQKKKSIDAHSTRIKKICAKTDDIFPCPKRSSFMKNGIINGKPSAIAQRKLSEVTTKETPTCNKRASIRRETNPKTEITKNLNTFDTSADKELQLIDLYNNKEIGSFVLHNDSETCPVTDNSIHEQNNLANKNEPVQDEYIHKSITSNIQELRKDSTIKLKEMNEFKLSDNLQKNSLPHYVIENDRAENPLTDNNENKPYESVTKDMSEKQIIDEYVAYMNKGGLLLLKLKVKLKDCKTIFNKDKCKNMPMAASLSNLPITEKTSQVDINISFSGELLKSNDPQHPQDKSLQSLLNKLYTQDANNIKNKDPRIIIIQCACRDNSDKHDCCKCQGTNEERINHDLNETLNRCVCPNESIKTIKTLKDEYTMTNGTVPQLAKETNDRPLLNNGTRVKDLAQKFENRSTSDNINNSNVNKDDKSRNEIPRQSSFLANIIYTPPLEQNNENRTEENNYRNSKNVCDKSTQTDWCHLLLEARRHDDDNYTFHLPPLYLLKKYHL